MLHGEASKTFIGDKQKKYGGFGNFENNKFISKNERMDEIDKGAIITRMEKDLPNPVKFTDII